MTERATYLAILERLTDIDTAARSIMETVEEQVAIVTQDDLLALELRSARNHASRLSIQVKAAIRLATSRIDPFNEGLTVEPAPAVTINSPAWQGQDW